MFRKRNPVEIEQHLEFDEIVTCLPVIQEVLQGFDDQRSFDLARESILALPVVESPMRQDLFLEAINLYRTARRAGVTVRSSVDCLIAVSAMRNGLTILHHDRDYENLARVSPLDARGI